ncbi:MAG: hypothetical protein HC915_02820 [Anaerolineae bacterium]|nr:hypothetical protein [Anaerolineae bacterium]
MAIFQYDPAIWPRFPLLSSGVILAEGVQNRPTPPEALALYQAEQAAVRARLGDSPLSEVPSLAGWRAAFRQFNVEPTKYRSAAEALLRRLTKSGDIPSLNLLVDLGNLVSIRHALPVAVLDTAGWQAPLTVQFAKGDEVFVPLGQPEPENPEPGEVIFADEAKAVMARRWCWRQSDPSAARESSTHVLITIEAQHEAGPAAVDAALQNLVGLLAQFGGGQLRTARLTPANPAI